ncbi:hypothetical protein [Mycolicibacter kumamotonensis]
MTRKSAQQVAAPILAWVRVGQAQLEPTEASVLAMLLPALCTF